MHTCFKIFSVEKKEEKKTLWSDKMSQMFIVRVRWARCVKFSSPQSVFLRKRFSYLYLVLDIKAWLIVCMWNSCIVLLFFLIVKPLTSYTASTCKPNPRFSLLEAKCVEINECSPAYMYPGDQAWMHNPRGSPQYSVHQAVCVRLKSAYKDSVSGTGLKHFNLFFKLCHREVLSHQTYVLHKQTPTIFSSCLYSGL